MAHSVKLNLEYPDRPDQPTSYFLLPPDAAGGLVMVWKFLFHDDSIHWRYAPVQVSEPFAHV